ncbi:MAG: succinate dehydrogenase cytochrome b subunit [Fimbriimonadaceae bacterium]|nr:succinate dehydrogenase cytochrome b subunit [Fimbriimonadaceae bacterium]
MTKACWIWRTTIGKKAAMAVTGVMLLGFLVGHLLGNLKVFLGPEAFNHYAVGLRHLGDPFLPERAALLVMRLGLIAAAVLHVVAVFQLRAVSAAARPVAYTKGHKLNFTPASSAMFWGGLTLAASILAHLAHLTWGTLHQDFRHEVVLNGITYPYADAYHNLVSGFQVPWVAALYLLAQIPLAMHLYHGLWSACQTLGLNHPKYNHWRRPAAAVVAIGIAGGYCLIPLAVLTGLVTLN